MIQLTDDIRQELRRAQRIEHDKRCYTKITILLMLDGGFSVSDVAFSFGLDDSTIYRHIEAFTQRGLDEYLSSSWSGSQPKLNDQQRQALSKQLQEHLYGSAQEIVAWIAQQWGVFYSISGILPVLQDLGFVYKKTKLVGSKADSEQQRAFLEDLQQLRQRQGAEDVLYYCDAVHPQHNTRSSYGWIRRGEEHWVKSNTGRTRVNINAAINAEDVGQVVMREDDRMNGTSTIKLYEALQQRHPLGKIRVICDNAKYYRSRQVRAWLEGSRVIQVFLPTYSPNLNVIERLWKFLRKKVIDGEYYEKKEAFREAIFRFFENIGAYRKELETLLTLKFHIP